MKGPPRASMVRLTVLSVTPRARADADLPGAEDRTDPELSKVASNPSLGNPSLDLSENLP